MYMYSVVGKEEEEQRAKGIVQCNSIQCVQCNSVQCVQCNKKSVIVYSVTVYSMYFFMFVTYH